MPNLDDFLAVDRGTDTPMRLETGLITSWTGSVHTVNILGIANDNPAYEVGASYSTNDVVLCAKYKTNYVILFKITRL
jgi:hypothetical protein